MPEGRRVPSSPEFCLSISWKGMHSVKVWLLRKTNKNNTHGEDILPSPHIRPKYSGRTIIIDCGAARSLWRASHGAHFPKSKADKLLIGWKIPNTAPRQQVSQEQFYWSFTTVCTSSVKASLSHKWFHWD